MNFIFDSYENAKYDKIIKTRGGKQLAFIEFNYVTKETRILTGIGIILGLFGGKFLTMFVMRTCELDMLMFVQEVKPMSFVYGFVITIIFAEIVNIAVNHTLKKISMTESLKSVD